MKHVQKKEKYACFIDCDDTLYITDWCIDSGATSHMTNDKSFFTDLHKIEDKVFLPNDTCIQARGLVKAYYDALHCGDRRERARHGEQPAGEPN